MNYNYGVITEKERLNVVNFESAKDFLFNRLTASKEKLFKGEYGLKRSINWLAHLKNPQESYPSIHIAGTSGKRSTGYMISSILSALGQKVGTITSPHVYDVRERLLINQQYISEEEFIHRTQELIPPIARLEQSEFGRPTYFEVMIGMAYKCFAEHNINYAVIETGIGGRFDSTNTIKRNDKLAVITRLGLDHTEILGSTPEEIAWQKAGIIPENGHIIALLPNEKKAKNVIEQEAKLKNSSLAFVNPSQLISNLHQEIDGLKFDYLSTDLTLKNLTLPTLGPYQAENACVAIATAEYLAKRDSLKINSTIIKNGFTKLNIPARAEITDFNGTPIIIDSAHNFQKLQAFFTMIEFLKLPLKPLIIFSSKQAKDWEASLPILISNAEQVFVASFFNAQPGHLQKYSADPKKITRATKKLGGRAKSFNSPTEALTTALSTVKTNQPIIITGSMYMLGELHDHLQQLS